MLAVDLRAGPAGSGDAPSLVQAVPATVRAAKGEAKSRARGAAVGTAA
jgi:hypothetical protein